MEPTEFQEPGEFSITGVSKWDTEAGSGKRGDPLHVAFAATAQMLTGSKQDVQGPGVACPPLPCEHL